MTPEPTAIASLLASYGGWGLSAILMVACVALFRMLITEKNTRITESRELTELALDLKRETNTALAHVDRVIDALGRRTR